MVDDDGIATALSAGFGGSPTTTYGENIGVMSATRVYSTAAYWVAGIAAILLSLSPKVGAAIFTIPPGVLGGVTFVLYGLIGIVAQVLAVRLLEWATRIDVRSTIESERYTPAALIVAAAHVALGLVVAVAIS